MLKPWFWCSFFPLCKVGTLSIHLDYSFSAFQASTQNFRLSIYRSSLPTASLTCHFLHRTWFIIFRVLVGNRNDLFHLVMNLLNTFSLLKWKCLRGFKELWILTASSVPRYCSNVFISWLTQDTSLSHVKTELFTKNFKVHFWAIKHILEIVLVESFWGGWPAEICLLCYPFPSTLPSSSLCLCFCLCLHLDLNLYIGL